MPLPLALPPLALALIKVAAGVAAGAAIAARGQKGPERVDATTEEVLDRLSDGLDVRLDRHNGRADGEMRLSRALRLGPDGPGIGLDFASMTRLRLKRLRREG